jgi:hypothetical protein
MNNKEDFIMKKLLEHDKRFEEIHEKLRILFLDMHETQKETFDKMLKILNRIESYKIR